MEENPNPTPPVSNLPISQPPPSVIPGSNRDPESNAVKKSTKFSIKAIILTIIFLLLAGGAAAGLIVFNPQLTSIVSKPTFTSTSKPKTLQASISYQATNWKAYVNSRYGFSLRHPADWKVTENHFDRYKNHPLVTVFNSKKPDQKLMFIRKSDFSYPGLCSFFRENGLTRANIDNSKDLVISDCPYLFFEIHVRGTGHYADDDYSLHEIIPLFVGRDEESKKLAIEIVKSTEFRDIIDEVSFVLPPDGSANSQIKTRIAFFIPDNNGGTFPSLHKIEKRTNHTAFEQSKAYLDESYTYVNSEFNSEYNYWYYNYIMHTEGDDANLSVFVFDRRDFIWFLEVQRENFKAKPEKEIYEFVHSLKFKEIDKEK